MNLDILNQMIAEAARPEAAEATVCYLTEHLRAMLKKGDKVLICFSNETVGGLGWLMEQAVLRCEAVPVIWGPDYRWKTVLQQAFYSRAGMIIAPPLIVLGLCKLKKYTGLPLYIRHAVTAGYPCLDWMIEGIQSGLDCKGSGCFGFGETGIIAGFSCDNSSGVHLREDTYGVRIVDAQGNALPAGETGMIEIFRKDQPQLKITMDELARIEQAPCACGDGSARMMDMRPGPGVDPDLMELGQQLHSWTSVLDCWVRKGECGLELELMVFAGEKLPKLPSAAKLVVKPWDPKHDTPFYYAPTEKNGIFDGENH